jgi:hypothetical protein
LQAEKSGKIEFDGSLSSNSWGIFQQAMELPEGNWHILGSNQQVMVDFR